MSEPQDMSIEEWHDAWHELHQQKTDLLAALEPFDPDYARVKPQTTYTLVVPGSVIIAARAAIATAHQGEGTP